MLKLSANLSLLFAELPLAERFSAAKRAGFDAVEIQFPYELSAELIAERAAAAQVQPVLFNVPAGDLMAGGEGLAAVPERREEFRRAVEQAVAYARVLKPKAINVLAGRCLRPERTDEYLHTLKANLRHASDALAGVGVPTVFEGINTFDMPGFLVSRGQQMLELLAEVDHPNLALQYDAYHMVRMGEDPAAFIAAHADKIGHIQFADAPGRGQPGTGAVDFAGLFAAVAASGYGGYLGAEYKPVGGTEQSLGWMASYGSPV